MSEKQQPPPLDIEGTRWDADSFTVEGMNLELENLREQKNSQSLIKRYNQKSLIISQEYEITRVYKHQDNRHRHQETEFRYTKDVTHDPR